MKIFDPLISLFKRTRANAHEDPDRDWLLLISVWTTLVLGTIGWNVWAFNRVSEGAAIGTPTTTAEPTFDTSSLDAIQKVFSSRASEESKYVTGVYQYTDPSQ